MRLFIAIDLTDEARAAITAIAKRIAARLDDDGSLRFVRAEQMHLTLAFIGEVDETRSAAVVAAMDDDLKLEPFELVFGGIGVFPMRGAPRALWLGVVGGRDATVSLQRQIVDRLETVGIAREGRPFSPHLTLARWRRGRRSNAKRALDETVGPVAQIAVAAVTLYESRLTSAGPNYRALRRTALAAVPTRPDM